MLFILCITFIFLFLTLLLTVAIFAKGRVIHLPLFPGTPPKTLGLPPETGSLPQGPGYITRKWKNSKFEIKQEMFN